MSAIIQDILNSICPPAHKQPEVEGEYLCTVDYFGLSLDVYGDGEGYYSGIALKGSKVYLCDIMSPLVINEIERMALSKVKA